MPPKFTGAPVPHSRHEQIKRLRVKAGFYSARGMNKIAEAYLESARRKERLEVVTTR